MKKLLLLFVLPVFLTPFSLDNGQKDLPLTSGQRYQLSANLGRLLTDFNRLPQNPNLYQASFVYADKDLTKIKGILPANQPLSLTSLTINDKETPIFQLADGGYLPASQLVVFDDLVFDRQTTNQIYWTKEKMTFYSQPYVLGVSPLSATFPAYSPVKVIGQAKTQHGTYLEVEGQGWVHRDDLSSGDNRIEKVQAMLNQKYNKPEYGIYVKQLATQNLATINADKSMYSASVAKLPILYYVAEQLRQGTVRLDDRLLYTEEVNQFKGAYAASGSSKLSLTADNKDYSIEELLQYAAQNSDNVASNLLGYYIANQYDSDYQATIKQAIGQSWDMQTKEVSARLAGQMMEKLYEQDSSILDYLSSTDFDNQRISKDIAVRVAHKIGDADDYKHDVALVYAQSPFVLAIFTDKANYDDLTAIANDVYEILK